MVLTIVEICLACILAIFMFFIAVTNKRRYSYLESEVKSLSEKINKQDNLNNVYAREISSMGKHLSKIESRVYGLDDRVHKIKVSSPDLNNYQQATMIFKKGGSLEEVLGACSISEAEAKFVQSLVQKESQV